MFRLDSKLAKRVLRRSGITAFVALAVFTLVFAVLSANREERRVRAELDDMIEFALPNIARFSWNINHDGLTLMLTGLETQASVKGVRYSDRMAVIELPLGGEVTDWSGCSELIEFSFVGWLYGDFILDDGKLEICHVKAPFLSGIVRYGVPAALPAILVSLIIVASMMGILRRSVIGPIEQITRIVREKAISETTQLDRLKADDGDEIDLLYDELLTRAQMFQLERDTSDLAFHALRDGIAITTGKLDIQRSNPALGEIAGLAQGEITGLNVSELFGDTLPDVGEPGREFRFGEGRWLEASCELLPPDTDGERRLVLIRDLTRRKELEEENLQSQKVSALGMLSSGVAHDFNNILAVILSSAELLRFNIGDQSDRDQLVEDIINASERGSHLTKQLLTYAHKRAAISPEVIDLFDIARETCDLAARTLGSSHIIKVERIATTQICADRYLLGTILLNLITNARDATPAGGEILVRIEIVEQDGKTSGKLSVVNRGDVIPPEILPRLTDPFFTTKPEGKGTGLGLSMADGFAKQVAGELSISSSKEYGTQVSLTIPAHEWAGEALVASDAATIEDIPPGQTVLVIDDDPGVRESLAKMCISLGCIVSEAGSGDDLEKIGKTCGFSWDRVICDLVLKGENGLDLCQRIWAHTPDQRVVILSGNVPEELGERLAQAPVDQVLVKPINRQMLIALLSR